MVAVLIDSADPKQYIKRMRQRDEELAKGWVQIVPPLSVDTPGGKQKKGCINTKGLLRIIQSIRSIPVQQKALNVGCQTKQTFHL